MVRYRRLRPRGGLNEVSIKTGTVQPPRQNPDEQATHHARTLTDKQPTTSETDVWAQAFALEGYEDYTLTLGRINNSQSGATHYRHILGPDNHICAIDPRDEFTMKNSANYT